MTEKLTALRRAESLDSLMRSGWSLIENHIENREAIQKIYAFSNFVEAFGWMTRCAIWAEKWNHHPEWVNVYGKVEVTLFTHDAGGLTELDFRLARKMDSLAK